MESHSTRTYVLGPKDSPIVVSLTNSVALHYPAWKGMPHGFSIDFTRDHLPILRTLCQALETLTPISAQQESLTLDLDEDDIFGPGNPQEYGDST